MYLRIALVTHKLDRGLTFWLSMWYCTNLSTTCNILWSKNENENGYSLAQRQNHPLCCVGAEWRALGTPLFPGLILGSHASLVQYWLFLLLRLCSLHSLEGSCLHQQQVWLMVYKAMLLASEPRPTWGLPHFHVLRCDLDVMFWGFKVTLISGFITCIWQYG